MGLYTTLARPLLFRLRPEFAQAIGDALLRATPLWRPIRPFLATTDPRLEAQVAGLRLPNPLGAAAGIDKNCRMLPGLLSTGFGFAVGGTVTLTPRPGNVRPRLMRDTGRRALVNAMGFPGDGLDAAEARLRRLGDRAGGVWVSVSGTDDDDIAECHRRLQPLAAAVEVNVSSPNTAGLRVFHAPARLRRLLDRLVAQKDRPLFVKLPPWASEGDRDAVLPMAETAAAAGVDGLVIANTHPVEDGRLAVGRGGLSGAPLFDTTLAMVREARATLPRSVALVACGGVSTADHVWALMSAGASAVQLYTALVYEGPGLPGRINRGLIRLMEREGVDRLPGPGGTAGSASG